MLPFDETGRAGPQSRCCWDDGEFLISKRGFSSGEVCGSCLVPAAEPKHCFHRLWESLGEESVGLDGTVCPLLSTTTLHTYFEGLLKGAGARFPAVPVCAG